MNCVNVKLPYPEDGDIIELVPIADVHLGDSTADIQLFKDTVEYIRSTPNCYTILNGDIINNATKTSPSDVYGAVMSPMEQLELAVSILEPIKDKILCIQDGNHERRTMRTDGMDVSRLIAMQLGLSDRYSSGMTLLFIRFPSTYRNGKTKRRLPSVYRILCTHGAGGGRTAGAKVNRMTQLTSIVDADIYLYSHTHMPAVIRQGFLRADARAGTVKNVDKLFINTGAYLGFGGYGEQFEFVPPSTRHPHIYLDSTKADARVAL